MVVGSCQVGVCGIASLGEQFLAGAGERERTGGNGNAMGIGRVHNEHGVGGIGRLDLLVRDGRG